MRSQREFDRWTAAAVVATILIALAYLPWHHVQPILSIGLPALVYALLGRPLTTAMVGLLSVAAGLVAVVLVVADAEASGRRIAQLVILALVAVGVSFVARRWRERIVRERDGFRLLAENASDVVVRVDPSGTIRWVSPSSDAVLGLSADDLVGHSALERMHPDDAPAARAAMTEARGSDAPVRVRFRDGDDEYAWLSATVRPLGLEGYAVGCRRIDSEVAAERGVADSERRYRLLADNATDIVLEVNNAGDIAWASPSAEAILGIGGVGQHLVDLVHPADVTELGPGTYVTPDAARAPHRVRLRGADGNWRWMDVSIRGLDGSSDAGGAAVLGARDVDAEVRMAADLARRRAVDSLTLLPRRDAALQWIAEDRASGGAVLCLGVSGMTSVNDAYTHEAGDLVLRAVAERLVAACGRERPVARVAGDEFVIVARGPLEPTDVEDLARGVIAAVDGRVEYDGHDIDVAASVGLVRLARDADPAAVLRDATAAMRGASRGGGDRWAWLASDVEPASRRHLQTRSELGEALRHGELEPWLMPVVSMHTHEIVGFEGLARWRRRDGSIAAPDAFMDVAERSGQIVGLDRVIIEAIMRLAMDLPAAGGVAVSANVSVASLLEPDFVRWLVDSASRIGVEPSRIHLEVTETALSVEADRTRQSMEAAAEVGFHWWVDDFGTGYSSAAHLRDWPVRGLKLDRSFTSDLEVPGSRAARLAEGLAGLARGMDLRTVAEGVETEPQERMLREQGWELGQGWLYGKARPAAEALAQWCGENGPTASPS